MYYDPVSAPRCAGDAPAPFRVDFVTGGDPDIGCIAGPEVLPLALLYFCEGCSRVVSKRDLAEDVESYYCPHCLENMPSSEAMLYHMHCSKCWECPVCASTIMICVTGAAQAEQQSYFLACGCCRWNSKGRLETSQSEQLVARISAQEKESETKQRMATLVDAFRARAQQQHQDRELDKRLRRRSTIGRASIGGMTSFAAVRRYSNPLVRPQTPSAARPAISQLEEKAARPVDLRSDAREAVAATVAAAAGAGQGVEAQLTTGAGGPRLSTMLAGGTGELGNRLSLSMAYGGQQQAGPDVPVLEGLSVEQLLKAHGERNREAGTPSLLEQMRQSVEEDVQRGGFGVATAAQRLQQVSHGYQGGVTEKKAEDTQQVDAPALRTGEAQLEAPLRNANAWALLPVRKPLLTKRNRRCRLLVQSAKPSGDSDNPAPYRPCKSLVVKPQISPTANPPFQKNNVAIAFIPRCNPWAWRGESGSFEGGEARATTPVSTLAEAEAAAAMHGDRPLLKEDEAGELVFTMANPLDSEVEMELDPMICNEDATPSQRAKGGSCAEKLAAEQNVQVLTAEFKTTIMKYSDLADVTDQIPPEDATRMKALKELDDVDVIPDRKLYKILVRLRFKALYDAEPWVLFARLSLSFVDTESKKHEVTTLIRLGQEVREIEAAAA